MVRWDSPLFTVTWLDKDIPGEDIWKAITEGNVKPPNAGTQAVRSTFLLLLSHFVTLLLVLCVLDRSRKHRLMLLGHLSTRRLRWSPRSWLSNRNLKGPVVL